MSRRRGMNSLNKVGEVYGVFQKFQMTKKPPSTADVKKRRIKYKAIDHEDKKKELHAIFESQKFIVGSQPCLENISENRKLVSSSSQPESGFFKQNSTNMKTKVSLNSKKGMISNHFVETFSTTISSSKPKNRDSKTTPHNLCKKIEKESNALENGLEETPKNYERQPSLQIPLRSNEIIRNIHTVKREKRLKGKLILATLYFKIRF